jgi:hypothetical protein
VNGTADALFNALVPTEPDRQMFTDNLQAVMARLVDDHGFTLTPDDKGTMEYIYRSFFAGGVDLSYNGFNANFGDRRMPSFWEVLTATDQAGLNRSYLGNEANYRAIKDLQEKNLIVPLVGDFAGPKVIRTVGQYLKERQSSVAAFYLSNVEQYLFQQRDDWSKFYKNVGALPIDSSSTFIRAVFNGVPAGGNYLRSISMLASIEAQMKAFEAGEATTYYDVIRLSH